MKISVILPVYNEQLYVQECLKSIIQQNIQLYEIIIVDDGSTDDTKIIIKKFIKKYQIKNFKYIYQKHQGPAVARNIAAKYVTGQILISLDADMIYNKYYISRLIKPILTNDEIAVTTSGERVANLDNWIAKFWDIVTFNQNGFRGLVNSTNRDETFRAIKTKYFQKSGGFDSYGMSDDVSVLKKLHHTAKCIDNAYCYHQNPTTLIEVFYSARWMGRDRGNIKKYYKFIIFSPFWSLLKAIFGMIKIKDYRFIYFRLIFDFGYILGLFDINFRKIHYK
jgi:glycosyltransferase involved in cell wall biosynthesis